MNPSAGDNHVSAADVTLEEVRLHEKDVEQDGDLPQETVHKPEQTFGPADVP